MFCPACWANIPDGSARCPKCQADSSPDPIAEAGREPPRTGAAGTASVAEPKRRDSLARLNLLLAILIAVAVGGTAAMRWYEARQTRQDVAGPPGGAVGLSTGGAAVPPTVEPEAADADSAEAELAREAYRLYQQGRIEEACERYEDLAFRVGSDRARRNLGSCLAHLGQDAYRANEFRLAAHHYRRSLEAYPETAEVWIALAHAHVKTGDFAAAERTLADAAVSFPSHSEVLYLLADTQERQGRTREAAETLRHLLRVQPGHTRARRLLASLEREQKFEGSYWSQESRHFLVRYEGAGGIDLGRSVVDTLEDAYDSIGRDLGAFPTDRIQVGIYRSKVLGEIIGIPPHYIAGAYDGKKIRLNLSASNAHSHDLERLVRHEYTHAVIHVATRGRAPIWLHEGLAQVMEPRSAPRFLEVSVPREYLSLRGIERLSRTGNPEALVAGYSLTHIAVEYLVERGGFSNMRDFLTRLGRGEPIPGALREAFGFGPEDVEARLLAAGGKS